MSRPKGSKNKPKPTLSDVKAMSKEERLEWLSRRAKTPQAASTAEEVVENVKKRRTRTTTSSSTSPETSSSGVDSAQTATIPTTEVGGVPTSKIIKGFVNIQKSRKFYYTGGDIHPTEEAAKAVSNKLTVATIYIAFEVK